MLFHTWIFLVFFLIFFPVYSLLRKTAYRLPWLLLASYAFYAWWNPLYLGLIVYSTVLDYAVVRRMEKSRRRSLWLAVSIVNNLALLGFFKYGGFVIENLNALLAGLELSYRLPAPDVLLPVGISFYTFQSMSYTIDYYRGSIAAEHSFVRFATFVSLFPQLVAGPIERARTLLPQLEEAPRIALEDLTDGASLFLVGLFKKVALANYLALYVDQVYASPEGQGTSALIAATFFFAWQIYFDFSGYTDMARGIARVMGLRLMVNFNHPYLATDLGEFWRRWHISLSTWFRDYVYIPLGGNRGTAARTYLNIFLTMVISGLWHGAAWTFVIWGALHAVGRLCTLRLERAAWYRSGTPAFVRRLLVFAFVCFTWIFFRAESLEDALVIVREIVSFNLTVPACPLLALALILLVWTYQLLLESPSRRLIEAAPGEGSSRRGDDPVPGADSVLRGRPVHLLPVLSRSGSRSFQEHAPGASASGQKERRVSHRWTVFHTSLPFAVTNP